MQATYQPHVLLDAAEDELVQVWLVDQGPGLAGDLGERLEVGGQAAQDVLLRVLLLQERKEEHSRTKQN